LVFERGNGALPVVAGGGVVDPDMCVHQALAG
jgi:hypothetical protein